VLKAIASEGNRFFQDEWPALRLLVIQWFASYTLYAVDIYKKRIKGFI